MGNLRIYNKKLQERAEKLAGIVQKDTTLFMAIRPENEIHVYYKGGRILVMNTKSFNIDNNYDETTGKLESSFNNLDHWETLLPYIKACIHNHNANKKSMKERGVEQAIICKVNSNPSSDYYLVDMEYTPARVKCGTFDLIAISKKKIDGKYILAIIELKQGIKALSGKSGIEEHVKKIKKFLTSKDCAEARGHLRAAIFSMIDTYKKFDLPYAEYYPQIINQDEITIENIQPLLLCVGNSYPEGTRSKIEEILGKIEGIHVRSCVLKDEKVDILTDNIFF